MAVYLHLDRWIQSTSDVNDAERMRRKVCPLRFRIRIRKHPPIQIFVPCPRGLDTTSWDEKEVMYVWPYMIFYLSCIVHHCFVKG